ncbi:hypothetical protein F5148DRAFT_136257 [Russula earlei]|uniref:Uncharacterized protein n=1 Tax=Russula earlei TaxID=71964 RepID=A0ACC0TRL5_9AGAM|nr:hypothetical protein F5148DRAFT_136257 [Russula earlei]
MDINTWRNFLLLPNHQDVRVRLWQIHEMPLTAVVQMSSFNPLPGNQMRLPASVRLVEGLPAMMQGHLGDIINKSYSGMAAGTVILDDEDSTPEVLYNNSDENVGAPISSRIDCEASSGAIAFRSQEPSLNRMVITDHSYRLNGEVKILWEGTKCQFHTGTHQTITPVTRPSWASLCTMRVTSFR